MRFSSDLLYFHAGRRVYLCATPDKNSAVFQLFLRHAARVNEIAVDIRSVGRTHVDHIGGIVGDGERNGAVEEIIENDAIGKNIADHNLHTSFERLLYQKRVVDQFCPAEIGVKRVHSGRAGIVLAQITAGGERDDAFCIDVIPGYAIQRDVDGFACAQHLQAGE